MEIGPFLDSIELITITMQDGGADVNYVKEFIRYEDLHCVMDNRQNVRIVQGG